MKYVEASKRVFLNTGTRFPRNMIRALALIKKAAARANYSLGLLDSEIAKAIEKASDEVAQGLHDEQIVVDVYQTGSGTGINMNLNELIAQRASQISQKSVHPNDHVNMGQSSNDVVPSTIRVATALSFSEQLAPALKTIVTSLENLSQKTSGVYKAGRTHLRDALPVTLGQEFGAYAEAFKIDLENAMYSVEKVKQLPLGGTAVGTGLNAHPRFAELVVHELNGFTGLGFKVAENKFRAMRLLTDLVFVSSSLRVCALNLYRLCQDLRLMFSGPFTALDEIDIPTQEEIAGSSIMPGKTNPVTVESAMLVAAEVCGLDLANQQASMYGEFELAMGVPLIGYNVCSQMSLLSEALHRLASVVIDHVQPKTEKLKRYAESSPALITILSPVIGYDKASEIAKQLSKGVTIREALSQLGYSEDEIKKLLDFDALVKPGIPVKNVEHSKGN